MRERDPAAADAAVLTVEALARETLEDVDRLVGALREDDEAAERAPAPGLGDVPRLVEQHRGAGLDVTLRQDGVVPPLPAAVDRAAYRIVQEALTNAARHGAGGDTTVAIRAVPGALRLEITNPVAAPRSPRPGGGRGLPGMRERVALLDGTLSAGVEGARFVLAATLPLPPRGGRS
jgi:signal transduction histidine kinase